MLSTIEKKQLKGNWKQRLIDRRFSVNGEPLKQKSSKKTKIFKKSLLYLLFLKKLSKTKTTAITYFDLKILKIFLSKYGKIKARRKTKISIQKQKQISKAIRRARVEGLLPFTVKVIVKKPLKKRKFFSGNQ